MSKLKCLNIGCGSKFHPDWENIDLVSYHKEVKAHNVLKGLPYPDNTFHIVYHSQFLEHIPKEEAQSFIAECHRVLRSGGHLRVVVPDLENIVKTYQKQLSQNLTSPTAESETNYDWIMLELYDQVLRQKSGGAMKQFLENHQGKNHAFLTERMGHIGREIQGDVKDESLNSKIKREGITRLLSRKLKGIYHKFTGAILGKKYRLGHFRSQGEVHQWMYDRFSLARLLNNVGFQEIEKHSPFTSSIKDWPKYELDVKENLAFDPTSLFMEARK